MKCTFTPWTTYAVLFLVCGLAGLAHRSFAQCTPDENACTFTDPNLPACVGPENAPEGREDEAYEHTVNFVVGTSVEFAGQQAEVSRVEVVGVDNLPQGLTVEISGRRDSSQSTVDNLPQGLTVEMVSANTEDGDNGYIGETGELTPEEGAERMSACGVIAGTPSESNVGNDTILFQINAFVIAPFVGEVAVPGNPQEFPYKLTIQPPVSRGFAKTAKRSLELFPNPAQDQVQVRTTLNGTARIEVVNTMGQVLRSETITAHGSLTHTLNVADLSAGLYFVRVLGPDGLSSQRLQVD